MAPSVSTVPVLCDSIFRHSLKEKQRFGSKDLWCPLGLTQKGLNQILVVSDPFKKQGIIGREMELIILNKEHGPLQPFYGNRNAEMVMVKLTSFCSIHVEKYQRKFSRI